MATNDSLNNSLEGQTGTGEYAGSDSPTFTTQVDVDNLRLSGNTISSTDTNGDVNITPDGTGYTVLNNVKLDGNTTIASPSTSSINIGENATSNFGMNYGNPATSGIRFIDFHSSGNSNDYDVRVRVSGGTSGDGGANFRIQSATNTFDGECYMSSGLSFDAGTNTLDEYEEGTWPPTLVGSTTAGSHTYTVNTGNYTRIGNIVTCSFLIIISSKDAAMAGNIFIAGLPFQITNTPTTYRTGGSPGRVKHFAFSDQISFMGFNAGTGLFLYKNTSGTAASFANITAADVGAAPLINGTIIYEI